MTKDVEYYMALPWEIEYRRIPRSLGGGFEAYIELLGGYSTSGWGQTKDSARIALQYVMQSNLEWWILRGKEIPEPEV